MTLAEKAAQMVQVPYAYVTQEEALLWARRGAGSFLHVMGEDARSIQREAMSTRLGIPVLFGIDAIHGHGLNRHAAIFLLSWRRHAPGTRVGGGDGPRDRAGSCGGRSHWTFSPVLCLGRDTALG
jgi:beta-glucosidase